MGMWVSAKYGYGYRIDTDYEDRAVLTGFATWQETQKRGGEIGDEITAYLNEKLLPEGEAPKSYYDLDKRTGFTLEPVYVYDYPQGYLLLLASREFSTYNAISAIDFDHPPLTEDEAALLAHAESALGLKPNSDGWWLGVSYG